MTLTVAQMQDAIATLVPGTVVTVHVRSPRLYEIELTPVNGQELSLRFEMMPELARILRTERLNFRHYSNRSSSPESGSWGDLVVLTIEAQYP